MRRLGYLLLLIVLVGTSARCVNASTDCERWFASYRSELAHTRSLQRIAAAKRRAERYARLKLAGYVPKPAKLRPHVARGPRMPRRATMHRVDLACGVLPESESAVPMIAEEIPAEFIPGEPLPDEISLLSGFDGPGTLPEESSPTAPVFSQSPPVGGGAPIYTPPFTEPIGPTGGSTPPSTTIPPPVVPEPSSYILLLTGLAGAAGVVRRRGNAV
jgi:hypothetical protein